jgi:tetratricopeptide (TPR) repeat protein
VAAVGDADFERREEAEILLWEGQLHARSGDYDAALAAAEGIRELMEADANPRKLEAYHGLRGLVDLLQGNYEQSASHFEQSDLMKPYVKYHLALAQEGAGRTEEAKALFREVAEYNFNSVDFALVRRDALERAG